MESITAAIWLPIQPHELARLELMLKSSGVMVPGNYRDDFGPTLTDYISNARLGGIEFRALFDRNLISPIASLVSGKVVDHNPEQARLTRLACASMCFCIWGNILVEPSMALYEFAAATGHQAAQEELAWFRIADNADPQYFLQIALGHSDSMPAYHLQEIAMNAGVRGTQSQEKNFGKTLRMWRPNYLYVLKTLDLMRTCDTPVDAARKLMSRACNIRNQAAALA